MSCEERFQAANTDACQILRVVLQRSQCACIDSRLERGNCPVAEAFDEANNLWDQRAIGMHQIGAVTGALVRKIPAGQIK